MHIYYFQVCSETQTTGLRLPSGTDCPPTSHYKIGDSIPAIVKMDVLSGTYILPIVKMDIYQNTIKHT